MVFQEKRRFRRIAITMPIDYLGEKLLQFRKITDISQGGVFIKTNKVEPPGTKVKLILIFPDSDESIEVDGVVVRISRDVPIGGMGIMFTQIPTYLKHKLQEIERQKGAGE